MNTCDRCGIDTTNKGWCNDCLDVERLPNLDGFPPIEPDAPPNTVGKMLSKEDDEWMNITIFDLWEQGYSDRKIGYAVGRSYPAIQKRRVRMGLSANWGGGPRRVNT